MNSLAFQLLTLLSLGAPKAAPDAYSADLKLAYRRRDGGDFVWSNTTASLALTLDGKSASLKVVGQFDWKDIELGPVRVQANLPRVKWLERPFWA